MAFNSASSVGLFALNVAITFFLSPIIIRQLGNRDYGIWELLLSLSGYLGLVELGIPPAIVRFIGQSSALGNDQETRRTFWSSALAMLSAGLLSLIAMIAISRNPDWIFGVSAQDRLALRPLCVLTGFNLLVTFSGCPAASYFIARQEYYRLNILRATLSCASGAATYVALTRRPADGLILLSLLMLAFNCVQYGVLWFWALQGVELRNPSRADISARRIAELAKFGISSFVLMLSDRIRGRSMPFVIGQTIGVAKIVYYSVPARLGAYGSGLLASIGAPFTPAFAAVEATSGAAGLRHALSHADHALRFVLIGISLGFGIVGSDFISIWIGRDYAENGKCVVAALAVGMLVSAIAPNSGRLLVSMAKHGPIARQLLAVSVLTVLGSALVARPLGLTGVAVILAGGDVSGFLLTWRSACRSLKVSMAAQLREVLKSSAIPAAGMALALASLRALLKPETYIALAAVASVASLVYALLWWFFAMKREEREAIAGGARRVAVRCKAWLGLVPR